MNNYQKVSLAVTLVIVAIVLMFPPHISESIFTSGGVLKLKGDVEITVLVLRVLVVLILGIASYLLLGFIKVKNKRDKQDEIFKDEEGEK